MKTRISSYISLLLTAVVFACTTNSLDPTLAQNKTVADGIKSTSDLKALILGAYATLKSWEYYGSEFILLNEIRGTNVFSNGFSGRYTSEGTLTYNSNYSYIWTDKLVFRVIAIANLAIATDVSNFPSAKEEAKHIKGEAYALRALAHFDLLKGYGQINTGGKSGVPYITEYKSKELYPKREAIDAVKTKILADLEMAYNLMSDDFFDNSKTTMSRYTAKALECRVSLYFEDWRKAKEAASVVIGSKKYEIIPKNDFVSSWEKDSNKNSLFELAFSATENLGPDAIAFLYRLQAPDTGYGDIQVLDNVLDIFSDTDVRRNIIGDQYGDGVLRNMGKYPDIRGYNNVPLVRYEEVVLSYAEALLELGLIPDATAQVNKLAENRGVTLYSSVTKEDILSERRKELMFEGFIFDDLMRTRKGFKTWSDSQEEMEVIPYSDPRLALPIPINEINANPNMEQNKGY